jgi:hypothetical protein
VQERTDERTKERSKGETNGKEKFDRFHCSLSPQPNIVISKCKCFKVIQIWFHLRFKCKRTEVGFVGIQNRQSDRSLAMLKSFEIKQPDFAHRHI